MPRVGSTPVTCVEQEGTRQLEDGRHPGGQPAWLREPRPQGAAFAGADLEGQGGQLRLGARRAQGQPRQPQRGRCAGLQCAGRGRGPLSHQHRQPAAGQRGRREPVHGRGPHAAQHVLPAPLPGQRLQAQPRRADGAPAPGRPQALRNSNPFPLILQIRLHLLRIGARPRQPGSEAAAHCRQQPGVRQPEGQPPEAHVAAGQRPRPGRGGAGPGRRAGERGQVHAVQRRDELRVRHVRVQLRLRPVPGHTGEERQEPQHAPGPALRRPRLRQGHHEADGAVHDREQKQVADHQPATAPRRGPQPVPRPHAGAVLRREGGGCGRGEAAVGEGRQDRHPAPSRAGVSDPPPHCSRPAWGGGRQDHGAAAPRRHGRGRQGGRPGRRAPTGQDMLPSSLKLNNEAGPPKIYYSEHTSVPREGGRTALHVACEREDNYKCARDVVRLLLSHRADTSLLWSGHSPLSLSIVSGNDLIVKELLSHGANPNLLLTKGLGSALCVACDLAYEHHRSTDSKLALIDRLISYGADILNPVTLTQGDKVAVGTAVDYGYFRFFQDRKIAHCPFHTLTPAERETFLARKRLLDYMGVQLRRAVLARESQWDPKLLCLSKRVELTPYHRLKRRSPGSKGSHPEEQELIPFFKFCYQCGRSVGVRLAPCARCYGMLACSKNCKTKAWADFHKRDCSALASIGERPPGPPPRQSQTRPRGALSRPGPSPGMGGAGAGVPVAPWGGPAWAPQGSWVPCCARAPMGNWHQASGSLRKAPPGRPTGVSGPGGQRLCPTNTLLSPLPLLPPLPLPWGGLSGGGAGVTCPPSEPVHGGVGGLADPCPWAMAPKPFLSELGHMLSPQFLPL
ncbi:ankyrin repeat and MYND domain-containing protein 1 isoform X10 [Rousettus aegyptiacus]|uniref:ankyrin repeat and MYND domain-containing protein 1 isoform X10 n=1 Tax=Rousettus aegyptiacus TaxID=9407 RepID=UPI00168CD574|nr:ankyrin repeat and MYND domain-containing protein 1 isoform X10 [Rousettus aegyptiacus]